jgi:hypothetical protein
MAADAAIPEIWSHVLRADTLAKALERLAEEVERQLRILAKHGLEVSILDAGPGFAKEAAELNADLRTLVRRCRAARGAEREVLLFLTGFALGGLGSSADVDATEGRYAKIRAREGGTKGGRERSRLAEKAVSSESLASRVRVAYKLTPDATWTKLTNAAAIGRGLTGRAVRERLKVHPVRKEIGK